MTKAPPFFVLALPRSRTAWLARYLSAWPTRVAHDLTIQAASAGEYVRTLKNGYDGTVETAAMIGWDAIQYHFPGARVAVVLRPVDEVLDSFARNGITASKEELTARAQMLGQIASIAGVHVTTFAALDHYFDRQQLFTFCTGRKLDPEWDADWAMRNVQIDLRARFEELAANAQRIQRLKDDVARYHQRPVATPSDVDYAMETWEQIWPECDELGAEHFEEVDGGVEPNRPYKVDAGLMGQLFDAGIMHIATARRYGRMVGYCTWNVMRDPESEGLLIAKQGAWFTEPGLGEVGRRLFLFSVNALTRLGVQNIFPHHRMQGRGKNLGKFFESLGAKEVQHEYSLWIGEGKWPASQLPS